MPEPWIGEHLARGCARAAADKKAEDILILDLRGISSFTDFFVICSASSEPQLKAINASVREFAKQEALRQPLNEDGFPSSHWIAIDLGEVVVHIFHSHLRGYYNLEQLWKDAPLLPWQDGSASGAG